MQLFDLANDKQLIALRNVYNRCPLFRDTKEMDKAKSIRQTRESERKLTFYEFAELCEYSQVMQCIMVPWLGMWLGIEKDGYTHS